MGLLGNAIRSGFRNKKIAVIGDLVADQFLNGTISRVSREAPVFILKHNDTITFPGAAANAAANVASLGGSPVLFGFIGGDQNGERLLGSLEEQCVGRKNVIVEHAVTTTTKIRVLAGQHYAARQQVIRIDYENAADIPAGSRDALIASFVASASEFDAIIVSDYGYGVVSSEIYAAAVGVAKQRNIPIVVDSRYRLETLKEATAATPNREEVENLVGPGFTDQDCADLRRRLGCEALLVTNGNRGVSLFTADKDPDHIDAVGPTEPVDVTGAGDTVIAAFSLGLASGLTFADAAAAANHAGGIVVMKKGTATVTADELIASIESSAPLTSTHAK